MLETFGKICEKEIVNGYIEKIGFKDSFWTLKFNGESKEGKGYLKNHMASVNVMVNELINNKFIG